jgi:hypothetical protein
MKRTAQTIERISYEMSSKEVIQACAAWMAVQTPFGLLSSGARVFTNEEHGELLSLRFVSEYPREEVAEEAKARR